MALWHANGREPPLPGLFRAVAQAPSGPSHGVYQPSLCIVLQGAKVSQLGDSSYRYDAGKCLITSLDVPIRAEIVDASVAAPYIAVVVNIDECNRCQLCDYRCPDFAITVK